MLESRFEVYGGVGVTAMGNEYRIEPAGNAFIVIDPWGERLVDVFPTEEAAKEEIERCKKEDAMYETAKQLVHIAIETHMQKFGIDRETARYWVSLGFKRNRCRGLTQCAARQRLLRR